MKNVLVLCTLLAQVLNVLSCHSSALQAPSRKGADALAVSRTAPNREWRAATYQGLAIGTATRAEMLRVLGQSYRLDAPADQAEDEPNPEEWYIYDRGAELPGTLTVVVDKRRGVVLRIDVHPENLSKEEAIRHFGHDYIMTRYEFCEGYEEEESAPLYETPDGQFLSLEYRARGIAIGLDNNGKVGIINYVSKPIGTPRSRCHDSDKSTANN